MASEGDMPAVEPLERGNIVFFYRPKRHVEHPKSPEELQRVYFILLPDDQVGHKNRLFNVAHGVFPTIVPGKAVPEERDWAFVEDASQDPKAVLDALEKEVRAPQVPPGERVRPWARAAGQGRYAIARHEDHTHLAYWLGEPHKVGEVQKELQIRPEASYVISVKEPFAPSEIELEEKPSYPQHLRNKFDGHGWIPADPTSFLDYQYTQVLLVGARVDVEKELGFSLDARVENKAEKQVFKMLREEGREAAEQGVALLEPLTEGMWE
jgi:hypothetical protein